MFAAMCRVLWVIKEHYEVSGKVGEFKVVSSGKKRQPTTLSLPAK